MATSSQPVSTGPAPFVQANDVRMLSDHENRLHFFDRFAKDAPKLAGSRTQGAN
ncbi:MAG: hypothetical protein ABW223_04165 [Rariglobus sp.]